MKDFNLLIKKLTNKAEFVDRCTWVLGSENGRNAFASCNSIGDFKKALSAGYSCYYISPDVFSGDFRFENVLFEGKPNGLSVDVVFRLRLFPEAPGFADWVKEIVSLELTKAAFVEKIRAPKYGLKDFLQEWFVFAHDDKLDFGLLQKYGKGALREYVGQSRYIEPWLHIDGMQWIRVDDIPASERESLEKFNEIQRKHADELKALREKTAFEVSKISIEEALAIAQSNQCLAEVSRRLEIKRLESDIAKANAEKAEAELRELQAKKAKEGLTNQQSERLISLQEGITQYYKELKWRDSRIEELECLIDSLTKELEGVKKKLSDKDWYDELSAWGKVLRHVRSITAMLFYVAGFYCILAGCKYSKLDASGKVLFSHLSSIGQWFAFVEAAIFWLTAFILNGQTVKKSFNEIKYWWIELFKGKIKVNLPLLICGFFRIFAASYLMVIGAFAVIWIPYLFIWGFIYEFQKEFFTGVIVICMAASGLGLGSYTLGARLLMKRRIRATSISGRKWVMIIFIPLLFIAFYDEKAARRVDNLEVKISEMFLSKKERDVRKAIKAYDNKDYATWWTLVANLDQDDRRIVGRLGDSYFLGLGIKSPDYRKAVEQYEKLLEKVGSDGEGYASVEYFIGLCYHGLSEYNTAIGYFKNAIGDGEFDALLYAGQYYEFGLGGCELDLKEAAKYFERALKSKNEKVREKAEEYLKRVRNKIDQLDKLRSSLGFDNQFKCDVSQGEDKRLFKRKVAREESELKKSTEAAIQAYNQKKYVEFWNLLKEADKEDVRIIVRMGDAYKRGYGVKIDLMGAIKEYEKIRNVKVGAQRAFFEWQIAACYHDLSNYNKSAEYARFAINNGCSEAWILIGSYTEQGLAGYMINLEEAKECYEKALTSSNATVKKLAQDGVSRVKAKIKAMKSIDKESSKVPKDVLNRGLDDEKRLCDDEIYRNFTTKHGNAYIESRRNRFWDEIKRFYPNVMNNLKKASLLERCGVAFYFAAFSCEKSISYILDKKILDVNDVADSGFLHSAAWVGDEKMVDFLIARGADVNKQDKDGQAPISWARSLRMIKYLIERHGAKITDVNDDESLFMDILKHGIGIEALKYIIEERAYVPTPEELTKIHSDSYDFYGLEKNKELREYIESRPWEKKDAEKLAKEARAAFAKEDWKTGFDMATNLSMNAISDSYVTYHVGYCYSPTFGMGYPKKKDYEKAYEWFKHTAELEQKSGNGVVQCVLGDMEMNGQGCATNIDNAVAWYRISAERKYGRGCYELGKCYEDNIVADTNDNLVAAKNWYFKAMSLKYKPAKEAYVRVVKRVKERDAVSKIIWNYDVDKKEWEYDSELLRRFASVHKDYQRKYVYVKVFMDGKGMSKASNLRLFTIVNKLLDLGIGADKIICSYQEEDVDMMMGPFNLGGITELTIIDKIPNRTTIKGSRLVKDSEENWRWAYFLALAKAMNLHESKK